LKQFDHGRVLGQTVCRWKSGDSPESLAERILVEEQPALSQGVRILRTVSYFERGETMIEALFPEAMSHFVDDEYR